MKGDPRFAAMGSGSVFISRTWQGVLERQAEAEEKAKHLLFDAMALAARLREIVTTTVMNGAKLLGGEPAAFYVVVERIEANVSAELAEPTQRRRREIASDMQIADAVIRSAVLGSHSNV